MSVAPKVTNKGGRPRKEQRRRAGTVHGRGRLKLKVPEIPGYYCRWVYDEGTRIHEFTVMDDYDFVQRTEIGDHVGENSQDGNTELGSRVRVLVGKDEEGKPLYQYLLKKKLDFQREDLKKNEIARREKENALRRGSDRIEHQYGEVK